jgi:hypothetical protein
MKKKKAKSQELSHSKEEKDKILYNKTENEVCPTQQ